MGGLLCWSVRSDGAAVTSKPDFSVAEGDSVCFFLGPHIGPQSKGAQSDMGCISIPAPRMAKATKRKLCKLFLSINAPGRHMSFLV